MRNANAGKCLNSIRKAPEPSRMTLEQYWPANMNEYGTVRARRISLRLAAKIFVRKSDQDFQDNEAIDDG